MICTIFPKTKTRVENSGYTK